MSNFKIVQGTGCGRSHCNVCGQEILKGGKRLRFSHGGGSYKVQADLCASCVKAAAAGVS